MKDNSKFVNDKFIEFMDFNGTVTMHGNDIPEDCFICTHKACVTVPRSGGNGSTSTAFYRFCYKHYLDLLERKRLFVEYKYMQLQRKEEYRSLIPYIFKCIMAIVFLVILSLLFVANHYYHYYCLDLEQSIIKKYSNFTLNHIQKRM